MKQSLGLNSIQNRPANGSLLAKRNKIWKLQLSNHKLNNKLRRMRNKKKSRRQSSKKENRRKMRNKNKSRSKKSPKSKWTIKMSKSKTKLNNRNKERKKNKMMLKGLMMATTLRPKIYDSICLYTLIVSNIIKFSKSSNSCTSPWSTCKLPWCARHRPRITPSLGICTQELF